jgi:hypothetical protein
VIQLFAALQRRRRSHSTMAAVSEKELRRMQERVLVPRGGICGYYWEIMPERKEVKRMQFAIDTRSETEFLNKYVQPKDKIEQSERQTFASVDANVDLMQLLLFLRMVCATLSGMKTMKTTRICAGTWQRPTCSNIYGLRLPSATCLTRNMLLGRS